MEGETAWMDTANVSVAILDRIVCRPSARFFVKVTDCMPGDGVSVSEAGKVRNVTHPPLTATTPTAVVMEYALMAFASVLLDTLD